MYGCCSQAQFFCLNTWRFRFTVYLKHPPSFGDSGHHSASPYILITPPFGDSGTSYIIIFISTPLQLAILNAPPHVAFSFHRTTLPHLVLSVNYISSTRFFLAIQVHRVSQARPLHHIYLRHAPSFGGCEHHTGSPYILSTPAQQAVVVVVVVVVVAVVVVVVEAL